MSLSFVSKQCRRSVFYLHGGSISGHCPLPPICWLTRRPVTLRKSMLSTLFPPFSVRHPKSIDFSFSESNARIRLESDCMASGTLSSYNFRSAQAYATRSASSETIRSKQTISQTLRKRSQATLMYLVALVIAMVGCSYAAVPLYRKFCQATGYGGTVRRRETVEEKIARHAQADTGATRQLVVQFNADVADGLPWKFTPTQREVKVKPGQSTLAFYTAENLSAKPITGVSTYNVAPMKAGIYFNKIQCFCFEEQRLLPGEKIDMPVFFYIDPEFAADPKMGDVNSLILSYTFFKVEDSDEGSNKTNKSFS